MFKFTVSLT